MKSLCGIAVVAVIALVGASGCKKPAPQQPPDQTTNVTPPETPKEKHLAFVPDEAGDMQITLVPVSVSDTAVTLDVVANQQGTRGVAFQLAYDPEALSFATATDGVDWPKFADVLTAARENKPGLLVGVTTLRGKASGLPSGPHKIARLEFAVKTKKETPISFAVARSEVVADDGVPVKGAAFAGGKLVLVE